MIGIWNGDLILLFLNEFIETMLKRIIQLLPDKLFVSLKYFHSFGRFPNLNAPVTFNEKLQWLKLYDRRDSYVNLVDKCKVKEVVGKIIGFQHIIPTLGVWDNVDQIDFDKLPNQFVLKTTHDSGTIIICKDKTILDIKETKNIMSNCLKRDFYAMTREWPYKNVPRKIIAEEYVTVNGVSPNDIKFFCFNGKVKLFKVDFDRFVNHKANYYDGDCNLVKCGEIVCPPDFTKGKELIPCNILEMIHIAEKLSKGIPFVRVDLYSVNKTILFGEMTFFPNSGCGKFTDEKWDYKIGEWLKLPIEK